MTYITLGWISVGLLTVLILPYILNYLNRKFFKLKTASYRNTVKFLRKLHKPLGIILLIIALIHGYMALGSIRLHTGTLFYVSIIITAALGGSFYKTKKKAFFTWHRRMAFLSVLLFLIHYFVPGAIYHLLN